MDVTRWSSRLPAHDYDLWIMRAAYARQFPWTMAELGRALGISRSQASRTVQRLVGEGFLLERGKSYDFNEKHPLAVELGRWIYLMTGAERRDPLRAYPRERTSGERIAASTALPACWRTVDLVAASSEAATHSALEARQAAIAIADACRGLLRLEDLAQEVYSTATIERSRDFIHLLMGLNVEADLAEWLLRQHAARQDVSCRQSPLDPVVHEVEWERVGLLLDAQASRFEDAADHVGRAYTMGRDAQRRRQRVVEEMATYPNYKSDVQVAVLEQVIQDAHEVSNLREDALNQGMFWHGGMPGFDEVGTLGDLLVKHALLRARDDLRKVQQSYAFPARTNSGDGSLRDLQQAVLVEQEERICTDG